MCAIRSHWVCFLSAVALSTAAYAQAPQPCDLDQGDLDACLGGCAASCSAVESTCDEEDVEEEETCWEYGEECEETCEQDCVDNYCTYEGTPWYIDLENDENWGDGPLDPGKNVPHTSGTPTYPFISLTEALAEVNQPNDPDDAAGFDIFFFWPGTYNETQSGPLIINQPLWLIKQTTSGVLLID